jgi:SAM-dependent methyltransferase
MNGLHRWYCRTAHWQSTLLPLVEWGLEGVPLGGHVLEIGPGQGMIIPHLVRGGRRVTAIDLDASAVAAIATRAGAAAVRGDATELPFGPARFTSVVAFTMLHHVPSYALQQELFHEVHRTLQPGGVFASLDVQASLPLRLFHVRDVWTPLSPETARAALAAAGFDTVDVAVRGRYFRFQARKAARVRDNRPVS